ncbi:MAG TPA: S8 family serine peptidase, partial [Xanthobacteraceae bacterium]|nr:S8 family serine peptidase [Xanthobacteraceae bacterium]
AHVSGVAALLLQRDPHLDSATIRQILTATAKNPSGAKGRNDELGYGVVDPERALNSLNAKSAGAPGTTGRAN